MNHNISAAGSIVLILGILAFADETNLTKPAIDKAETHLIDEKASEELTNKSRTELKGILNSEDEQTPLSGVKKPSQTEQNEPSVEKN